MIRFEIGQRFYADSTHPGWGRVQRTLVGDTVPASVFAEVALSGLSRNIALGGTGALHGGLSASWGSYFLSAVRLAVIELVRVAAYDDAPYGRLEWPIAWGGPAVLSSGVAAEVALSGLSRNIALGGRRVGSFPQAYKTIALRVSQTRYFTVSGSIAASFVMPAPQGFNVTGAIQFAVSQVAGTVRLAGAFVCAGAVQASFTPVSNNSFKVAGHIDVKFGMRAGQQATCTVPSDTPAAGAPGNAAY